MHLLLSRIKKHFHTKMYLNVTLSEIQAWVVQVWIGLMKGQGKIQEMETKVEIGYGHSMCKHK